MNTEQAHPSWIGFVENEDAKKELLRIETALDDKTFFPDPWNVLRFLRNDLSNVKGIIVGMDPYPSFFIVDGKTVPEATGRSFEIQSVESWSQKFKQASLRNILKTIYLNETNQRVSLDEIRHEIENGSFPIVQPHEWFDSLEKQGILFLNSTLTVEPGKPDSHVDLWKDYVHILVSFIFETAPDAKWLLWGRRAQNIVNGIDENKHSLNYVEHPHPRVSQFVSPDNGFKSIELDWLGRV